MDKKRIFRIALYFVFGTLFMSVGLSLYGVLNEGHSFTAELGRLSHWLFGLLFGIILAVNAWFGGRKKET